MLERDEIARSLTGAWELFLDRPDAMRRFDISMTGFWRSFRAIVLVLPAYLVTSLAEPAINAADPLPVDEISGAAYLLDSLLALGLDWIALPIVLALAAGPLGISHRYGAFVIARNWASVIATAPFAVISLLVLGDLIGAEIANFLMLAMLLIVLRYNYLIARRALDASIGFAVGIVVLDAAISLTVALSLEALIGI